MTTTPRTWRHDPSLIVQADIKDHKGRVIALKGTRVNPLETLSWGPPVLMIDGDDPAQLAWAKSQDTTAHWVLVKGLPLDLEEQTGRPIYFDQGSVLTQNFGITQVPCRITQQGKQLLVEELVVKGERS